MNYLLIVQLVVVTMTDLTLVIKALRYGPLFDMMDRRTGAALLLVNKGISCCVQEYVRLPNRKAGFAQPVFDVTPTGCKIGDYTYDVPGFILDYRDYIKCKGEFIPDLSYPIYKIHILDKWDNIIESISLYEKDYNYIMQSYLEYLKRFKKFIGYD